MGFSDDDLRLAFQVHVMELLAKADLVTTESEREFMEAKFPRSLLLARGFADADGNPTGLREDAAVEALGSLPRSLSATEKLALLEDCYQLAVADRTFGLGEGGVMLMAARLLGMTDAAFDEFVDRRGGPPGMTAAQLDRDDV
jgi:uncharacterized tellurite resistance protein B-like protein